MMLEVNDSSGEITCTGANFFNYQDAIDLGSAQDAISGDIADLCFLWEVTEGFVGAGARAQFAVTYTESSTFASGTAYSPMLTGGPGITLYMTASQLALGSQFITPIPRPSFILSGGATVHPEGATRYIFPLHFNYNRVTGLSAADFTAGKITASLVSAPRTKVIYSDYT